MNSSKFRCKNPCCCIFREHDWSIDTAVLNGRYCYKILLALLLVSSLLSISSYYRHYRTHVNWKLKNDAAMKSHVKTPDKNNQTTVTIVEKFRGTNLMRRYNSNTSCFETSVGEIIDYVPVYKQIPLIIHQIYKTLDIPKVYFQYLKGCQVINPEFLHLTWTDKTAEHFLNEYYPQYRDVYKLCKVGIEKSDFMRILILYHFGGIYLDMDVECKKPFTKFLDEHNSPAIFDRERFMQSRILWHRDFLAMNSLMISRRMHPFFKFVLDRFRVTMKGMRTLTKTGPLGLTDNVELYRKQKRAKDDQVFLADPFHFSPLLDKSTTANFNRICDEYRKKKKPDQIYKLGCDEWDEVKKKKQDSKTLSKSSTSVHRFLHIGWTSKSDSRRKGENICKELNSTTTVIVE